MMKPKRRQFMRFDVTMNVEFKHLAEERAYSSGTIMNFSRAGICLLAGDSNLMIDDAVELKLTIPQEKGSASAVGCVVWKSYRENNLMAGIRLVAMDRKAKFKILNHCYEMWVQKTLDMHND
jgi:c-di-GMP-binding flagellar brake protein YcgR